MVGTPTVTTSVGAEGLGVRDRREVLIADDPSEFAAAIERLLQRQLAWRRLARRGRRHILRLHGRAAVEARFDQVLEAVLARRARPAPVKPSRGRRHREETRIRGAHPPGPRGRPVRRSRGRQGADRDTRGRHVPRHSRDEAAGISPGTATESTRAITPPTAMRRSHTSRSCGPRAPRTWCCRGQASGGWITTRRSEPTSMLAYREIRSDEDAIVYELDGRSAGSRAAGEPRG